jgi:hypothetical protein
MDHWQAVEKQPAGAAGRFFAPAKSTFPPSMAVDASHRKSNTQVFDFRSKARIYFAPKRVEKDHGWAFSTKQ